MRRRFFGTKKTNYARVIISSSITREVALYGGNFDVSQINQILVNGQEHGIEQTLHIASNVQYEVEYYFNTLLSGDYFLPFEYVTVIEFNVDTSQTTSMKWMFSYCQNIPNLDHLDLTNVKSMERMFYGSKITNSPFSRLQDIVYNNCYNNMFRMCVNLTTAPELPATTLAEGCYLEMFLGCTNLNYIKMLATDISATDCLKYWVNNVASTGTFVKNAAMTSLPTGTSGIPSGWTVQNA